MTTSRPVYTAHLERVGPRKYLIHVDGVGGYERRTAWQWESFARGLVVLAKGIGPDEFDLEIGTVKV